MLNNIYWWLFHFLRQNLFKTMSQPSCPNISKLAQGDTLHSTYPYKGLYYIIHLLLHGHCIRSYKGINWKLQFSWWPSLKFFLMLYIRLNDLASPVSAVMNVPAMMSLADSLDWLGPLGSDRLIRLPVGLLDGSHRGVQQGVLGCFISVVDDPAVALQDFNGLAVFVFLVSVPILSDFDLFFFARMTQCKLYVSHMQHWCVVLVTVGLTTWSWTIVPKFVAVAACSNSFDCRCPLCYCDHIEN